MRRRYYVLVSFAYIILGFIVLVRSVMAHTLVIAVLGVVFLALGAFRLRDYAKWRGGSS